MRTLLMFSLFIMGMANLTTSLVLMRLHCILNPSFPLVHNLTTLFRAQILAPFLCKLLNFDGWSNSSFFSQICFSYKRFFFRNQRDCFMNLASASNEYPAQFGQSDDQDFSSSQSNTSQLIFSRSDDHDFSSNQSNTRLLIFSQSDDQDSSSQSNTNQLTFNQSDDQDSSSQSNTYQLTFNQSDDQDSSSQSNTSQLIFSKSENENMSTSQQVNIQTEADRVYSFIPVISCIFICFGYGIGLGPIPFILFGELFPSKTQFLFFYFKLIYLI